VSVDLVVLGRRQRQRRRVRVTAALGVLVVIVFIASLMIGNTFYGLGDVARVVVGGEVPGASFTVGQLRLPRVVLGLLAGIAFGIAGVTFQTMLRNPLASPDVIGVSSGASAAAVIGLVTLRLDDSAVSLMALGGALLTALGLYALANRGGFSGGRLILIGIGVAAMLQSVVAYELSRAAAWDLQTAMQWLTGSLNGATWARVVPLAAVCAVFVTALFAIGRDASVLRLGDDTAAALGLNVHRTRLLLLIAAVVLLAFATAAAGPISFVAFMAGPIATRLVGPGASLVVPAGLVGALLVLAADLAAQNLFDHRYPVGVITGILGAPYLVALLVATNRSGRSL
jgi:iron complex transport system permease protein